MLGKNYRDNDTFFFKKSYYIYHKYITYLIACRILLSEFLRYNPELELPEAGGITHIT